MASRGTGRYALPPASGAPLPLRRWILDPLAIAVLAVAALVVRSQVQARLGMEWPGGSDPSLWGLEAMNYQAGAPVELPPLFPMVTSWLADVPAHVVQAGGRVSGAGFVLTIVLAYALARVLGSGLPGALLAAAACLATPWVLALGLQLQPDSLNMALFTAAALTSVLFLRQATLLRTLSLVVLAAVAPLIREQGILVSALLTGIALLGPGAWWARVLRLSALGALAYVAPALCGQPMALPWETLWFTRVGNAMADTGSGQVPGFLGEYTNRPELYEKYVRVFQEKDQVQILLFYASHAWERGPWNWTWVATGLLAVPLLQQDRERGLLRRFFPWVGPLVALAPVLTGLVIYSEARHTVVALPTAAAVIAAVATTRKGWFLRWIPAVMACAWIGLGIQNGSYVFERLKGQATGVRDLAEFGQALCAHVEEGALGAGPAAAFLFCPLPRHTPRRDKVTSADWKTWWVDATPQTAGWARVDLGTGRFPVYRFIPELSGDARPCGSSMPPTGLPYRTSSPRAVELEPPCDALPQEVEVLLSILPVPQGRDPSPDGVKPQQDSGPGSNPAPFGHPGARGKENLAPPPSSEKVRPGQRR